MRIVLAVAALALSATAFAGTRGDGKLVTQVRNLRGFTKVEVAGSVDASIREGRDFQVKVTMDENLQSAIVTEVRGDTLVVRTEGSIRSHDDALVEVSLPDLRGIAAAGSGDVTATASKRKDLSIGLAGSGDLTYEGPAARLQVGDSGSGDITIRLTSDAEDVQVGSKGSGDVTISGGRAQELVAATAGSGSIDAQGLNARSGKLATTGSGDIEATLDGGEASFAVAGSGDITWRGNATVSSQARAGSGEIIHH